MKSTQTRERIFFYIEYGITYRAFSISISYFSVFRINYFVYFFYSPYLLGMHVEHSLMFVSCLLYSALSSFFFFLYSIQRSSLSFFFLSRSFFNSSIKITKPSVETSLVISERQYVTSGCSVSTYHSIIA